MEWVRRPGCDVARFVPAGYVILLGAAGSKLLFLPRYRRKVGIGRIAASPPVLGALAGPRRPGGYSNPAPATLEIIAAANAPVAPERPFHPHAGEITLPPAPP